MNVLALIPARGGSKRLLGKNIKDFCGKPLIQWTIEQAKAAIHIDNIIVLSDDSNILHVVRTLPIIQGLLLLHEPKFLADDEVPMLDVMRWVLSWLDRYQNYRPDIVILLQPTSPLRITQDIENALQMIYNTGYESVESQYNGKENGAIYASKRYVIMEHNRLLGNNLQIYEMPEERSVDIDTQEDFDLAEKLMEERLNDSGGVRTQLLREHGDSKKAHKGSKRRGRKPRKVPTI